ncbi:MAG: sulfatase family protein, partial [Candidatus Rokuibacteriota bacterium]
PPALRIGFGAFPRDKLPEVRRMYREALAYVDAQLEILFRRLKETGRWDRTIVVVTADHGEAFFEHGFAAHGDQLYEELVKVPLLLRIPGEPAAADRRPAQILDVPPTLLGALGLPAHPSFQGVDLRAPVQDPDRCRFVVVHTPFARQYAVLRSGYKLIYDEQRERSLLFDLRADPAEKRNLSGEEPERAADLLSRLADWYRAQIEFYEDPVRHARAYPPRR